MVVKIRPVTGQHRPGKLADAELHFTDGVLEGLKLVGFAIWERGGGGRNVTFPARPYTLGSGERHSYALLRPIEDAAPQERMRTLVLQAYAAFQEEASGAAS